MKILEKMVVKVLPLNDQNKKKETKFGICNWNNVLNYLNESWKYQISYEWT